MLQYLVIIRNDPELYMRMSTLFNGERLKVGDRLKCSQGHMWRVENIELCCENLERKLQSTEETEQPWSNFVGDYYD